MPDPIADLQQAIHDTNEVIAEISLLLPFVLNKLVLTRRKLIFETRSGLGRVQVKTLDVDSLTNVTASISPLFGIIYFSHSSDDFPPQVGIFWRKDVIRMKRIIDGYVLSRLQKIDTRSIQVSNLIPMLIKLGTDDPSIKR